jgi:hypothetical protein
VIAGKFKKNSQKRSLKITLLIDLRIVEMTFSKNLPLKIMHMVLTLILNDSLHLFLFSNILKNIFTFCVLFLGQNHIFSFSFSSRKFNILPLMLVLYHPKFMALAC